MADVEVQEARPGEVELALWWRAEARRLAGHLEVRNVCGHRVRLSGKPGVTPVGTDGELLDAPTMVTLEMLSRVKKLAGFRWGGFDVSRSAWGGRAEGSAAGYAVMTTCPLAWCPSMWATAFAVSLSR
jgi:hypothetical protein